MLPIKVTDGASTQIEEAADWWTANRPRAPEALDQELSGAFALLSHQPAVGARATNVRLPGVRRIYLSRVHYFLYYRLQSSHVEILALWHASRGKGPGL